MIEDLPKIAKQYKFENESGKQLLFKKRQNSLSLKMKVEEKSIFEKERKSISLKMKVKIYF